MAEDRDELLAHYRQTREALLAVIEGLSEEQMTERTLDGWSVKDHLAHLAFWDDLRATEVARISAGHESVWRMSAEQEEALNALAYDMRASLSLDQARWELAHSRQRLLDVIDSAAPTGLDGSRYGEAALRSGHEAQHTGWITRWREEQGY